jgi:hypothetical protein
VSDQHQGARLNRVSPVGEFGQRFWAFAPRLRERGWHLQWYFSTNGYSYSIFR